MPTPPKTFYDFLDLVLINIGQKPRKSGGKLSEVKTRILEALWNSGEGFPRPWVPSPTLLKLTKQKYFDRRIRELRDHSGCDIETGILNGQSAYRLCSSTLKAKLDRTYLSPPQKKALFENHRYICAACGASFKPSQKGLEADHKIPLSRGGGSEITNWQPLCIQCNVAKRRSCQGCNEACESCAWAFPEKFGQLVMIRARPELLNELRNASAKSGRHSQDLIIEGIESLLARLRKN